jgi:hypothetical protein
VTTAILHGRAAARQAEPSTNGDGHAPDFEALARKCAANLTPEDHEDLSESLGLPVEALDALPLLGARVEAFGERVWTFPERDGHGRIVGLSRRYRNGEKRAFPDSKRGLTVPSGWQERPGPILLPEGASDVLALAMAGLSAIGRPSNTGGVNHLAELLRDIQPDRKIFVLGENDCKSDGDWPGREGAEKTAAELGRLLGRKIAWALTPDGKKDARQWVFEECGSPNLPTWPDMGRKFLDNLKYAEEHAKPSTNGDTPKRRPIEKYSFARLAEEHPKLHDPVVGGLLREGEVANVISYSKIGKSWLAYSLALSIITGRRWLGNFWTSPGRVLLVDNELHKPTIAHRLKTVAEAMEIATADIADALEVWPLRGNLRSISEIGEDLTDVKRGDFKLIIFDAKYRMGEDGRRENDNADETAFYNRLDFYAEQTGAALVCIHHASKGNQSEKRITDVGAGAGAQSRAADSHIVLREHEDPDTVVLEAAVRSFAPVEPLALKWAFPLWVTAEGVDTGKLKGKLTVNEQRQGERDREAKGKIIDALRKGPATARKLREATGLSRERLERLLNMLAADGKICTLDNPEHPDWNEYGLVE